MGLKGADKHLARLRSLKGGGGGLTQKAITATLYEGADTIRAEAHRLISAGSVSGKGHVPSKPGEPPMRDTGNLQAHLKVEMKSPFVAEVRSEAQYAAALEFGTSKMAPRPYMRAARDAKLDEVKEKLKANVRKAIKASEKT